MFQLFLSIKHQSQNRHFWALWQTESAADPIDDDLIASGIASDAPSAVRAARATPGVSCRRLLLLHAAFAHALFVHGRLPESIPPITLSDEDAEYEAMRRRQLADPHVRLRAGAGAATQEPDTRTQNRSRCSTSVPHWSVVLNVEHPATPEALRHAFLRRAKQVHPDQGGSSEAFILLKRAYDDALRTLEGA